MRLQYLHCKKSRQSCKREEDIPAGLWTAWEKLHCHNGNFSSKWPYFPFWDPWRNDTQRFNDFLQQARHNLDPDEHVIFIYDDAPARRNPANPVRTASLRCSRRTAANKLVNKLFVEMKFYFLVLNSIRCTSVLLVWNIIYSVYSKIGIADQSNEFSGFPAFQNTVGKAPKV